MTNYSLNKLSISCGLPKNQSGENQTDSFCIINDGEYQFTLKHGFIGACPGDCKKPRERIELIGPSLDHGQKYSVEFVVRFDKDYKSQKGTKFFQIHQYKADGKLVVVNDPIFMLSIHSKYPSKNLVVVGQPLIKEGDPHGFCPSCVTRDELVEKDTKFRIDFSLCPGKKNDICVKAGGKKIIECKAFVACNGDPRLKFGLYRDCGKRDCDESECYCDRVIIKNIKVCQ